MTVAIFDNAGFEGAGQVALVEPPTRVGTHTATAHAPRSEKDSATPISKGLPGVRPPTLWSWSVAGEALPLRERTVIVKQNWDAGTLSSKRRACMLPAV